LKTRIKICGLTREEDVDAAVAAGADAIGFVFYPPSPRYVTPQRAAELATAIPPFRRYRRPVRQRGTGSRAAACACPPDQCPAVSWR
jgi:phosphoribosylanthranilate isomerase